VPVARSSPEQVDGDLYELDPDVLARLRGDIERIDNAPRVPQHLDPIAQKAVINRHKARQKAQKGLRDTIAIWAGFLRAENKTDSQIYRTFYFDFGIDIASAQALNTNDADELRGKIQIAIDNFRTTI
jgi:hypothetical protein